MSTGAGTLNGSGTGRSLWPIAILASLVMLTIAVAAVSLGREQASQTTQRDRGQQSPQTVIGGTAANTPSELSGGTVGGTAANKLGIITAGSSSVAVAATADVQAAIIAARNAADAQSGDLSARTTGNTPSELTGGLFERYGRHQRI